MKYFITPIKRLFTVLVIALVCDTVAVNTARAETSDDCTRAIPIAIVNSASNLITRYHLQKTGLRNIEEYFQLVDSHQVTIKQTGCHHFSIEYNFVLSHFSTDEKWILNAANALMKEMQVVTSYNINGALKAIQAKMAEGGWKRAEPIEVIKNYEWLLINITTDNNHANILKVAIDIAL